MRLAWLLSAVLSLFLLASPRAVIAQTSCIAECVALQQQCDAQNNQCVRRCHLVRGRGIEQCSTDCTLLLTQCIRNALDNCKMICRR